MSSTLWGLPLDQPSSGIIIGAGVTVLGTMINTMITTLTTALTKRSEVRLNHQVAVDQATIKLRIEMLNEAWAAFNEHYTLATNAVGKADHSEETIAKLDQTITAFRRYKIWISPETNTLVGAFTKAVHERMMAPARSFQRLDGVLGDAYQAVAEAFAQDIRRAEAGRAR